MENKPTTDKIVIVVHGFKRQGTNDFTDFVEYATDKVKYPIHNFTFFENEQKNTLGYKTMSSRIGTEFSKFADKEIIVIGYSIGGLSAIAHSVKMNNITAIYSIVPAYKIKYFEWITSLKSNFKKSRQLKKRLSKKAYKRMIEIKKAGLKEEYPLKIVNNMNKLRKYSGKTLKNVENKDIKFVFSKNDEVIAMDRTLRFIDSKLDNSKNNIDKYRWVEQTHGTILTKGNYEAFDDIVNWINKR